MKPKLAPEKDIETAKNGEPPIALNKTDFTAEVYKPPRCEFWFTWFRYYVRRYMMMEVAMIIVMALLIRSISNLASQVEKGNELLSKVQLRIHNLEQHLGFDIPDEQTIEESLTTTEAPKVETPAPICNSPSLSEPTGQFNAANYFLGARVDTRSSSSSDNNPFIGRDQSDYVLLDRKEPPAKKAWCSDVKEPVLSVQLSKNIQPSAVSYQHTKWNGSVPDGAPKVYDLVGCNDRSCEKWEPLAMNCTYTSNANETQEQSCLIPTNETRQYGFNKVQFRFRENHGNVEKTCAFVVRVYGAPSKLLATKTEMESNKETCKDLTWHYHNSPFVYNNLKKKNCSLLYTKNCCTDCPDCCDDCEVGDIHSDIFFGFIILFIVVLIVFSAIMCSIIAGC